MSLPPRIHPATVWGLLGVVILLVNALWRLVPLAALPFVQDGFGPAHWGAYAAFAVFMAWSEGYRGFQKQFVPRVIARAQGLPVQPRWTWPVAPAVCMGLLHATRRRLIISWVLLLGILALVLGVRQLPWEWRAIVDGGVVVGLGWGLVSLGWQTATAARRPTVEADFPR
ncbi:MAG: hypothetical protein ACI8PZ_001249 [Myxococcota bacterium]